MSHERGESSRGAASADIRRGPKNSLDPRRAYAAFVEEERTESGEVVPVATILLTNRECPWRCVMCDLWVNTLDETVPPGAIPEQIRTALRELPPARRIKLYNAGSWFDPRAIPPEEDGEVAMLVEAFDRVIVESHPALIGERTKRFQSLLGGRLEVALGLETAHPDVLSKLGKGVTTSSFRCAASRLADLQIPLRTFVLLGLPDLSPEESLDWSLRSIQFAFDVGSSTVALIPTRSGNWELEELSTVGRFSPPSLAFFESAFEKALELRRGLVLADTWEAKRFGSCEFCRDARVERLRRMNVLQRKTPRVVCSTCPS